jgi:hypothetical protein
MNHNHPKLDAYYILQGAVNPKACARALTRAIDANEMAAARLIWGHLGMLLKTNPLGGYNEPCKPVWHEDYATITDSADKLQAVEPSPR